MTPLEEALAQKKLLRERVAQYREALKSSASSEKAELQAKITTCRAMLRDLQVQIDHLDPPAQRKARKAQRKRLDIGAMSWDFFERCGSVWSDLEDCTWEQVEAGDPVELGASMAQLQQWMAEGSQRLTERQRLYLDAYYNQGLSLERIAQAHGVDKSTVSRVVKNGLARMQAWVDSKRLIAQCADGRGGFDWVRYLSQVPALTDRQRQLMLLVLSQWPKTKDELADKLELDQSTVVRTLQRAGHTVRTLGAGGSPISRPVIQDWETADKVSLARQTGMSLGFCYKFCYRERVCGLTRYQYELARRLSVGISPEETARELGLNVRTVRAAFGKLRRQGVRLC